MTDQATSSRVTWSDRYRELAMAMYAVRRRCPRLGALAVSALHPRNPVPPTHQVAMEVLADVAAPAVPSWGRLAGAALKVVAAAVRDTAIVLAVRAVYGRAARRVAARADIVLKTWIFGTKNLRGDDDFYYGDLVARLEKRGVRAVLVASDARNSLPLSAARAMLAASGAPLVPEWALVPVWAPLAALPRQAAAALALRSLARRAEDRRVAVVAARACAEALTPGALRNLLAFHAARAAVVRWRPRAFVTLYEGQPWEKLAWHGIKAAEPDCLTVGYQHTVVMRHSLALTHPNLGSWELAAPDVAICLGERTREMITDGHRGTRTRLATFGSFRWSALGTTPVPPVPGRRTVLVVPEGNVPECRLLFDAALVAARALPDHRFVFRCHPVLPFSEVRGHLAADPATLPNVEVSTRQRIENDFARASVVLYRGSSSVLYALGAGLKIVYLADDAAPANDPLFELGAWREEVRSPDELSGMLREYAGTPPEQAAKPWHDALDYVQTYTIPVDDAAVNRLLALLDLSRETAGA